MARIVVVVKAPSPGPLVRLVVGPRPVMANPRERLGRPAMATNETFAVARPSRAPIRAPIGLAAAATVVLAERHGHAAMAGLAKANEARLVDPDACPTVRLGRMEDARPSSPSRAEGAARSPAAVIAEDEAT